MVALAKMGIKAEWDWLFGIKNRFQLDGMPCVERYLESGL